MELGNEQQAKQHAELSVEYLQRFLASDLLDTPEEKLVPSAQLSMAEAQQLVLDKIR